VNQPTGKLLDQVMSAFMSAWAWLFASEWRAEFVKLAAILALTIFIMFRRDFGFTETPYNFF